MSDHGKKAALNIARESELTNPLAEKLWTTHGQQVETLDELLGGIGYLEEPKGVICQFTRRDQPRRRPATDKEARTVSMEWTMRLTADLTGDIPAQVAGKLKKLARRLMRAAKQVEQAAADGELPGPVVRVYRVRDSHGEILGTYETKTAALLHCWRVDGSFIEDDEP